jgi:hypothetical protein
MGDVSDAEADTGLGEPSASGFVDASNLGCSTGTADAGGTTSWTAAATGSGVSILAAGQSYPFGVVVAAENVYWTDFQVGVMTVPVGGGVARAVGLGRVGAGIAVDSSNVYWTETVACPTGQACPPYGGAILTAPLAGGAPTTLAASEPQANFVAVDATGVYWSAPNALQKVSRGGGNPTSLWSAPMPLTPSTMVGSPYVVAVANGHLYAAMNPNGSTGGTSEGSIVSFPIGGGPMVTLNATHNAWITGIAVDSHSVYWTSYGSSFSPNNTDGAVMKVPIGGGAATTIATGQHDPAAIAVDETSIYWGNTGTQSAGYADGSIVKATLSGGASVTLARGGGGVYGIAVDGTGVYWTTQNDAVTGYTCRGKVMKLVLK